MTANRAALRKIEGLDGFVVNYLLCGPFNSNCSRTSCDGFDWDYITGGEANARPRGGDIEHDDSTELKWTPYIVRHGFIINLIAQFAGKAMINYAAAYLYCPCEQAGKILIGSDDAFKCYVNGQVVGQNHIHRGLGVDADTLNVIFKKGVNCIILKIEHNFGGHEFCMRVTDDHGRGIKGMYALLDHPDVKDTIDPAKQRTVSGYDYLAQKFASGRAELAFNAQKIKNYKQWKKKFLTTFNRLLGKFPSDCPLKPEITEEKEYDNFIRRRLLIDFEPGFSIPCYVTVPKNMQRGEKLPAVLCLHGHGSGKSDMIGSKLGTAEEASYSNNYAIALHTARAGYVTISPDFLAFGESLGRGAPFGLEQDACAAEYSWAQMAGIVPTAVNIHRVRCCIKYMETLRFVDVSRIGAMGHSFGGYMTTMSTAVEPRIKVAVISGFICTSAAYNGKTWPCGSQVVPDLLNYGDLSDIVCTMAPRPVLVVTGLYDCVTPAPFAMAAFKKIKAAYKLAGAGDRADQYTFPGDHLFQPEPAIAWLKKWL